MPASLPATLPASLPASLLLVGAGRMGSALLHGWMQIGLAGPRTHVIDPHPSPETLALCERHGVLLNPAPAAIEIPDVVVLAVKPQALADAAAILAGRMGPQTLLISILAGKTIADLRGQIAAARAVVRAMPNTPAAIGRGITGAVANPEVSAAQRATAQALLGAVGAVEWLPDEALMDAVTAVSGSGPAYVFHLVECMAAAGTAAGLPAAIAERLARATVEGAAELLARAPALSPAALRENVTSPAGTTAAALAVLMGPAGLHGLMERAVAAAKQRAAELSGG